MSEEVKGRVAAVNPRGLKLEGDDGWWNFTKQEWRDKPFDEARAGDDVVLGDSGERPVFAVPVHDFLIRLVCDHEKTVARADLDDAFQLLFAEYLSRWVLGVVEIEKLPPAHRVLETIEVH